jgi:hypothetical protein
MKESSRGWISRMIYLTHYKNLCRCYNVPPPRTTIKKKEKNSPSLLYFIHYKGDYLQGITQSDDQSNFISNGKDEHGAPLR